MGTRGAVGFVVGGRELLTYNHWDSYPSELGSETFAWLQKQLVENADGTVTINVDLLGPITGLTSVDAHEKPTEEQLTKIGNKYWSNVDTGDNWYAYLRECQGDFDKTIESGFIIVDNEFPRDSLFCEWAYVIDVDEGFFDTYRGFQHEPPTDGRWVGQQSSDSSSSHTGGIYYPVQRIDRTSFADVLATNVEDWSIKVDPPEEEEESDD